MPGESPSTDPPWVMPDGFLVNVITHGGSVEGLSPGMPALGGYLSDAQVRQVILYVRSLASPPFQAAAELRIVAVPGAPKQPIFFSHLIHAGKYPLARPVFYRRPARPA